VSDALFEINSDKKSGWTMPSWLVAWEMDRDPEGWISRALKWGWVKEAVEWSSELLRNATPPELLPRQRSNAADLPYNLFDRVLAAAKEGDEKDDKEVQGLVKGLQDQVGRRIGALRM
jgi:nuclear pore complex protein Nup160